MIILEDLSPEKRRKYLEEQQKNGQENNCSNTVWSEKKIRYRCEQVNITKVEQKIISHSFTKKEYLCTKALDEPAFQISLLDFYYEVEPRAFAYAIDAVKDIEYLKENVAVKLSKNNELEKVLNFEQIKDKWIYAKEQLKSTKFFKEIEQQDKKNAQNILDTGDKEFLNEDNLRETYNKGLFFLILFSNYTSNSSIKFLSQLFSNIEIEIDLEHTIMEETDNYKLIETNGKLKQNKENQEEFSRLYDLYYRPVIKYKFSEYFYKYKVTRKICKERQIVFDATAILQEGIKNNYVIMTQFNLKEVEL